MVALTLDPSEMRERWMKIYLNLMVLKSTNPTKMDAIKAVKDDLALMNEKLSKLFDVLEA
jgi:hypothetical protein